MNRKGQGALEYLLLLVGAVLIAATVVSLLFSLSGSPVDFRSGKAICHDVFYPDSFSWEHDNGHIVMVDGKRYCYFGNAGNTVTLSEIIYLDRDWHRAEEYIKTDNGYISKSAIRELVE